MRMCYKFRVLIKVLLMKFFVCFPGLISDSGHAKMLYFVMFGKKLNINNPKTMNEYICSSKISDEKLAFDVYTDKYLARTYVESVIGKKYLNEVLGIYDSFDSIDFDALPKSFVLKATHGSSYNIIVRDKDALNKAYAKRKFDRWLSENYYLKDREKNYKNIKPRIMCDAFLSPKDGIIEEFKLFCFNGKVRMISYNKGEGHDRRTNLFDENWNKLNVRYGYSGFDIEKMPENKDELISLAERLAEPFEFVRVDLYNIDGKIYFSELTFHPGGGLVPFTPKEFDAELGKYCIKEKN